MELLESVKATVALKFAEAQRQRRLLVYRAKAAGRAFEMNRNVGENNAPFANGRGHRFSWFTAERFQIGLTHFNVEPQYGGVRGEDVPVRLGHRRL